MSCDLQPCSFLIFPPVSLAHSLFFNLQEDGADRQLPKETMLEGISERGQQRARPAAGVTLGQTCLQVERRARDITASGSLSKVHWRLLGSQCLSQAVHRVRATFQTVLSENRSQYGVRSLVRSLAYRRVVFPEKCRLYLIFQGPTS